MAGVVTEIRRGSARFPEKEPGRLTRHAFSFGSAYDPEHLAFGPMVCHDDHLLGEGRGFDTHGHRDLDIVTWVVAGALTHTDSTGAERTVGEGEVAVLRTGAGVEHSEVAALPRTRFVQVWLRSSYDGPPTYDVHRPGSADGLVPAAELDGARLFVARLDGHQTVTVPAAPRVHAYVVRGALLRFSLAEPLAEGDAFLLEDEPAHDVTAAVPTELLVWTFGEETDTTG